MVKIKICGITNHIDYQAAVNLGIDFTGFIFYESSPRWVNRIKAAEIIKQNPGSKNQKVGVFVNEDIQTIRKIFEYVRLDMVQLHGEETPEYCQKLGLPYWKVIRVKDISSLAQMRAYDCETFLLDTYSSTGYGGTGLVFDLRIAAEAILGGKKIVVSGGISLGNVDNILELSPYAVDINSSIEETPGEKNIKKMEALINRINSKRDEYGK